MKSFTEFMESRGHKVIASKLKDVESKGSFSYPTPEERRAQVARQKELENKKKTTVKEEAESLDERDSQEHDYIMQSLANKDINSHIKGDKVVVHKDNLSKAKSHLKKIGHGDIKVVHEGFEEIEEAKAPKLEGRTAAHVEKYALAMGWKHSDKSKHGGMTHPDHPLSLMIPRHKGDLKIGTLKQLQNRIELKDLHKVNHIRHKNKINDSFEIKSFKDYLTESVEVDKVEETTEEQDFEMMLEGIDSRLAKHIRHLRDSGHKVVITSKSKDGNSAKFISTDNHGNRKLHTITANGIVHKRIEDDKPLSVTKAEEPQKRGRGRPVGSKSGANVKV